MKLKENEAEATVTKGPMPDAKALAAATAMTGKWMTDRKLDINHEGHIVQTVDGTPVTDSDLTGLEWMIAQTLYEMSHASALNLEGKNDRQMADLIEGAHFTQFGRIMGMVAAFQEIRKDSTASKEYKSIIQSLINKVNVVTASHRHGQPVSDEALTELSNRQIDVEERVRVLKARATTIAGQTKAELEGKNDLGMTKPEGYKAPDAAPKEEKKDHVEQAAYFADAKTLQVKFRSSGSTYQYFDVPQEVFDAMKKAESQGKFLASKIKGMYRYSKV